MTRKTLVTQWSGGDDMKVAAWQGDTGETAHEDTKRHRGWTGKRGGGMRAAEREMEQQRGRGEKISIKKRQKKKQIIEEEKQKQT